MNRTRNTMPGGNMNGNNRNNGTTGMNNMNGTMNGRDVNGSALKGDLLEQIRALSFVKEELELYLDTHPGCHTALDYYHQTMRELRRLTEEYENTSGPLSTAGVTSTDYWTWVGGPWPWQTAGDFMRKG